MTSEGFTLATALSVLLTVLRFSAGSAKPGQAGAGHLGLRRADFRHVKWIDHRLCRPFRSRFYLRLLVVKAAVTHNRDFKIRGYTVGQTPNLPLVTVAFAAVVGRITEQESIINWIADSAFFVSLSIWSYLETFDGINTFRRVLGIAGFVILLSRLAGELQ